jgi:DNA-binding transcriptional ArsR family regulator
LRASDTFAVGDGLIEPNSHAASIPRTAPQTWLDRHGERCERAIRVFDEISDLLAAKMSVAPVLAALGEESRLQIVRRLCESGPLSITKLTKGAEISRQAVTKHLLALDRAGLVRSERHGRQRIWELEPKRLDEVRRYLTQISKQWDDALSRLKAVEE